MLADGQKKIKQASPPPVVQRKGMNIQGEIAFADNAQKEQMWNHTTPCAIMARATFMKPATLAPRT